MFPATINDTLYEGHFNVKFQSIDDLFQYTMTAIDFAKKFNKTKSIISPMIKELSICAYNKDVYIIHCVQLYSFLMIIFIK